MKKTVALLVMLGLLLSGCTGLQIASMLVQLPGDVQTLSTLEYEPPADPEPRDQQEPSDSDKQQHE